MLTPIEFELTNIEEDMPIRQVERYGDRWFSSREEYHIGLGPGLVDQPLSALDLAPEHEIAADEFEEAWEASCDQQT